MPSTRQPTVFCHLPLRPALALFAAGLLAPLGADELDPAPLVDPAEVSAGFAPGDVLQPLERTLLATRPIFNYRLTRIEGVLSSPGTERSTTSQVLSVALHWNLGESFVLRYSPSWTTYSGDTFDDNVAHPVHLSYQRGFADWNVQAGHSYVRTSLPLIETARQTTQDSHVTSLRAQRALGARTTLELGLRRDFRRVQNFTDIEGWATESWLHYQVTDAISTSVGYGFGLVDVDQSPDMRYHRLHGRVRWVPTAKLRVDFRAGAETRKLVGSSLPDIETPLYAASVSYEPLPHTRLALAGERSVSPSYFAGIVNRGSSWQLQLTQRMFERFHLDLSFVRRTLRQRLADAAVAANREDTGSAIRARVGTHFHRRGRIAVFYQHRRNSSTDAGFDFTGNQYGLEFTLRY